jgi:hypothetical protein
MENCFFYISRMYGIVGRGDHGHATAHEVGHERRQATEFAVQPVVLDRHVLTLDVAGFAEAFIERSGIAHGGLGRPGADEADDRHRRLLRARRERPRRCPTDERDELAPLHCAVPPMLRTNDSTAPLHCGISIWPMSEVGHERRIRTVCNISRDVGEFERVLADFAGARQTAV